MLPELLFFPLLVKGNEALGTRLLYAQKWNARKVHYVLPNGQPKVFDNVTSIANLFSVRKSRPGMHDFLLSPQ